MRGSAILLLFILSVALIAGERSRGHHRGSVDDRHKSSIDKAYDKDYPHTVEEPTRHKKTEWLTKEVKEMHPEKTESNKVTMGDVAVKILDVVQKKVQGHDDVTEEGPRRHHGEGERHPEEKEGSRRHGEGKEHHVDEERMAGRHHGGGEERHHGGGEGRHHGEGERRHHGEGEGRHHGEGEGRHHGGEERKHGQGCGDRRHHGEEGSQHGAEGEHHNEKHGWSWEDRIKFHREFNTFKLESGLEKNIYNILTDAGIQVHAAYDVCEAENRTVISKVAAKVGSKSIVVSAGGHIEIDGSKMEGWFSMDFEGGEIKIIHRGAVLVKYGPYRLFIKSKQYECEFLRPSISVLKNATVTPTGFLGRRISVNPKDHLVV